MNQPKPHSLHVLRTLLIQTLLAMPVAVAAGSLTAFFLWSLDCVTEWHWRHPGLLWALPLAGLAVGILYHRWGRGADRGNNFILDEIHAPGGGVPLRMAPLVLLGTLVTHLFGGSAGREGTAVQMGGSLAGGLARWFRLAGENRRMMLMCGVAAGFGAVFGTPLAGAVFAIEVLFTGFRRLEAGKLVPLMAAGFVGDAVCMAWGAAHTTYHLPVPSNAGWFAAFDAVLLLKVAVAGAAFGLAARLFAALAHRLQQGFAWLASWPPLRPVLGGLLVIGLTMALGTRDYLGLGVHAPPGGTVSIVSAFHEGGAGPLSWFWKTMFTAITVASGFKGGEVTPLFFIGATLGNTMSEVLQGPAALFAAVGFIAVFAGAANTPFACIIMGIELFGAHYTAYFALACVTAFFCSGKSGIYLSQRVGRDGSLTLRQWRENKAARTP